jgi:hypothetical protein
LSWEMVMSVPMRRSPCVSGEEIQSVMYGMEGECEEGEVDTLGRVEGFRAARRRVVASLLAGQLLCTRIRTIIHIQIRPSTPPSTRSSTF